MGFRAWLRREDWVHEISVRHTLTLFIRTPHGISDPSLNWKDSHIVPLRLSATVCWSVALVLISSGHRFVVHHQSMVLVATHTLFFLFHAVLRGKCRVYWGVVQLISALIHADGFCTLRRGAHYRWCSVVLRLQTQLSRSPQVRRILLQGPS